MNIDLNGKTALVCGASKGIGASIAIEFAKSGANVILLARSLKDLISTFNSLSGSGIHKYITADLQNPTEAVSIIKGQIPSLNCIDILVNNTGGPSPGRIIKSEVQDFLDAFNRHVIASQLLTQMVMPGMIERNWGRVINIISISVRQPVDNLGVSNTIRGAMASWAKTLANEVGKMGITVNSILPGFTSTERLQYLIDNISKTNNLSFSEVETQMKQQIPTGRFVKPEEIAYYATFLASEFAASINGTAVAIDGGYLKTI